MKRNILIVILCVLPKCVLHMDPLIKDLLTPLLEIGERCGYESCPEVREGWLNVHIVPHSHSELGYTNTFEEHYTGYDDFYEKSRINMKQVLDATISELWADKRRKFTLSDSELPYFFQWWSHRHDTVRRMVYELIRQGRLMFVGGGWGMVDEASTYYQSFIDSFTYTLRKLNRTFLECGRPLVAWQADTFGHSREYASLIAQMGYDGLFINPISFDDEVIRMERKGLEFVWRGSDDLGVETDIYTNKLFDGYWSPPGFCFGSMCFDPLLVSSDSLFNNIDERVDVFIKSILNRQAPSYNTKQVMVVMGQRMGYFNAKIWYQNIEKLIDNVNKKSYEKGLNMHVMYSAPACYLKAVHEENPILETKQDDFFPLAYNKHSYATGMYTSRPTFKYFVRQANIYLQIAKQLQVLAKLGNNDGLFEEFTWIMGVVQDHNIVSGAMRPYVMQYYVEKLHRAVRESGVLIEEGINKIRGSPLTTEYRLCPLNISSCPNTEVKKFYIILYNNLAWPVTMPVRLPILNKMYDVFDPKGNKITAVSMKLSEHILKIPNRRRNIERELVFVAEDIPPLGLKSYFMEETKSLRKKKSLIKKINKNNQKKYFIRQVNKENQSLFDDNDNYDSYTDEKSFKNDFSDGNRDVDVTSINYMEVTESNDFNAFNVVTNDTIVNDNDANDNDLINNDSYYSEESFDSFIRNKYIQINIDEFRKISSLNLSNGINMNLDVQFHYYVSDDPAKLNSSRRNPGAYIFRPMDPHPEVIIEDFETKIYKSSILEEIQCRYSKYASIVVKLYKNSPIIEVDWVVGPVPTDDELGRDVFIRYMTDLENSGAFYTDANGRQMVMRIRDRRGLYEPYNLDRVAGNYYPVTSRIYIEDRKNNLRFSVFNDRSQGGTSLLDGCIDLMIHRRILTDDSGVQTFLNETENGVGIIVRGSHYLYLTKSDSKKNRLFEKKFAKELELKPQIIFSKINLNSNKKSWLRFKNEYSFLKTKLPFGIHILTLQEWNDNKLLMRLENYLEKIDVFKDGIKKVLLRDLFKNIKFINVFETVLSGHIFLKDWLPLKWRINGSFFKNFNDFYGNDKLEYSDEKLLPISDVDINEPVILVPQQIRTFVIEYV